MWGAVISHVGVRARHPSQIAGSTAERGGVYWGGKI